MIKAVAWLEEGFDSTYERAIGMSRRFHGDTWVPDWCDTEYTRLFRPLRYFNIDNAFYSIKEDS